MIIILTAGSHDDGVCQPGGHYWDCCHGDLSFNILRLRQNGCRFTGDTFKCIFLNLNFIISIKISLKFVPKGSINNIPALVQIMAWRRPGDKPLSEPMIVRLPNIYASPGLNELSQVTVLLWYMISIWQASLQMTDWSKWFYVSDDQFKP